MWQHLLFGVGGVVTLTLLWVGAQEWIRRQTPGADPDRDMLQHLAHHCHGCAREGSCANPETGPDGCPGNV